jgi:hypothetical protein
LYRPRSEHTCQKRTQKISWDTPFKEYFLYMDYFQCIPNRPSCVSPLLFISNNRLKVAAQWLLYVNFNHCSKCPHIPLIVWNFLGYLCSYQYPISITVRFYLHKSTQYVCFKKSVQLCTKQVKLLLNGYSTHYSICWSLNQCCGSGSKRIKLTKLTDRENQVKM